MLDPARARLHVAPMLTRKHIEFGAKIYIVALIVVFTIYLVDVLKMMGILD
jgi:hypothetical protein